MGLRHRRTSNAGTGPLHLEVERYVHCPRGGMVPLRDCDACDLMQGTLWGDSLEVLCAYPEPVPALSPVHAPRAAHSALALTVEPAERETPEGAAPRLIFEADWPDD
jgi:hypothetical protein